MSRLHHLDYLRGIAAAGIMLFHFFTWTFGEFDSSSFFGRVGLYGVAIFYILSGLTLYHVYHYGMSLSANGIRDFFIKRIFRIFPLMWVATLFSIWLVKGFDVSARQLILNFTGLFGFVAWDEGIATGIWSIGNELVFYCMFPFLIFIGRKSWWMNVLVLLLFLAIYLWFAFSLLNGDTGFDAPMQKFHYVNPLNQAFLFVSGFMLGRFIQLPSQPEVKFHVFTIGGLLLFILYPIHGDRILLVTDWNRVVLTASCLMICYGIYRAGGELRGKAHWMLKTLGEISFSVYLLHPIVHRLIGLLRDAIAPGLSEKFRFIAALALTLVVSYISYHAFERWFIRLGKRLSNTL
jgi:exopolysaccharide production protein ExoZ